MNLDAPLLRNVAIIAHVDHGKTTLVDQLLYQSGMFRSAELDKLVGGQHGLIMDSDDLERERGITIYSKNCAIFYQALNGQTYKINIIDTPGHADFGGEVERVLQMASGVLLLVDAFEGPMPQTRFVLQKALDHGLTPILIINKVDRADARIEDVHDETLELMVDLGGGEEVFDAPFYYASGRDGWASSDPQEKGSDLRPILEGIIEHVPDPHARPQDPLQMLVTTIDFSEFLGRIAIGRVHAGHIEKGMEVAVISRDGNQKKQRFNELQTFSGLGKKNIDTVHAGDIAVISGLGEIQIGDTVADAETPIALPPIDIDQPTLNMTFRINNSPFSGREGEHVTSRKVKERLEKELRTDVALRVEPGETPEEFQVSGRGLMHLGILLETMRREGYELAAGTPKVITRMVGSTKYEPIETLVIDCPRSCQNAIMSLTGERRAEILRVDARPSMGDYVHMQMTIPARGLIGLRSRILTATRGQAVMHHTFAKYEPLRGNIPRRSNGVLISTLTGQVTAYALDNLSDRGQFFIAPGDRVYEGQIVGEHCKDSDLAINVIRTKKLSNVRAAGKDDAAQIRPPRKMALEACLEFIQDDELVEITPKSLRLRKRILKEGDRRRESRRAVQT
ncbi:MAG: translational GTPase TypA [Planctomycetota bacterium]|nr:translational GTPase TypA [Planctomycetota bacterium]